jgi:DNA-binding Lrp family transcriptional regulator
MVKIDVKDRKILYELDKNSRVSYSKIAKAVRLSQETVRYRVSNMIKKGVIKKFFTVVDPAKLGYAFYKVLIKLHNVDAERIQEIVSFLKKKDSVVWLVSIDGSYDLGFVVKVTNVIELSNLIDDLNAKYNMFISRRVISINIIGEYLLRDYLINKERQVKEQVSYTAQFKPYKIDEKDKEIIRELTKDSRISAIDIAKKLNISSDSVIQRLRKLEKEKVITHHNIVLNHNKLKQLQYKILLYLNNVSQEKIRSFINYCRTKSNLVYIIKSLGEWDYELDIEVENVEDYRKIMRDLTKEFSEIINDYNALIITKIYKYNLYP